MTEENYGKIWCLDHCYPLSKTNLSDKNEMNKSTNWITLRSMYCSENISEGDKIDHRLYLMQEIKAYQFIKLIKRDLTKTFINEIYSEAPNKNYPTNKIIYNHIDEIWSIDLADMTDYKISNNKVIDIYSSKLTTSQNICGLHFLEINIIKLLQTNFQIY